MLDLWQILTYNTKICNDILSIPNSSRSNSFFDRFCTSCTIVNSPVFGSNVVRKSNIRNSNTIFNKTFTIPLTTQTNNIKDTSLAIWLDLLGLHHNFRERTAAYVYIYIFPIFIQIIFAVVPRTVFSDIY